MGRSRRSTAPFRSRTAICCWSASRSCESIQFEANSGWRASLRLRGPLQALAQLATNPCAKALEPHRHGALADAHALRDLARGERSLEIEEANGLFLRSVAQAVDHCPDDAQLRFALELLADRGSASVREMGLKARLLRGLVVRRSRGEVRARAIAGDGEKPGRESLAILEAGERAERADERFLDHVVDLVAIELAEAAREPDHGAARRTIALICRAHGARGGQREGAVGVGLAGAAS